MSDYISIGQLSKLAGVSIQRIRYYDKVNLFSPSKIDSQTNYRYYNKNQLEVLNIIQSLQYIGFSLKEIKSHLEQKDVETLLKLFDSKIEKIKKQELALKRKKRLIYNYKSSVNYDKKKKSEHLITLLDDYEIYTCHSIDVSIEEITTELLIKQKEFVFRMLIDLGFSKSSWGLILFYHKNNKLVTFLESDHQNKFPTESIDGGSYKQSICTSDLLKTKLLDMQRLAYDEKIYLEQLSNSFPNDAIQKYSIYTRDK